MAADDWGRWSLRTWEFISDHNEEALTWFCVTFNCERMIRYWHAAKSWSCWNSAGESFSLCWPTATAIASKFRFSQKQGKFRFSTDSDSQMVDLCVRRPGKAKVAAKLTNQSLLIDLEQLYMIGIYFWPWRSKHFKVWKLLDEEFHSWMCYL